MQGDGTQANPYIPETWSEFTTAIGTSGAYVSLPITLVRTSDTKIVNGKIYFDSQGNRIATPVQSQISTYYENNFKFDMNAVNPLGVLINFNNCHVNGNGASIINLYIPDSDTGINVSNGTLYLDDINFLNMYCDYDNTGRGIFRCQDNSRNFVVKNVQFQGFINQGSMIGSSGGSTMSFTSVTFSLTFSKNARFTNAVLNDTDKYYKFCNFDFYGNPEQLWGASGSGNRNKFINCKMSGKLTGEFSNVAQFPSDSASSTNVIDVDYTESTNVTFDSNGSNPFVINTDKLPAETTYENMTGVTTAQLANAEYLRSVGFPCGD